MGLAEALLHEVALDARLLGDIRLVGATAVLIIVVRVAVGASLREARLLRVRGRVADLEHGLALGGDLLALVDGPALDLALLAVEGARVDLLEAEVLAQLLLLHFAFVVDGFVHLLEELRHLC